MQDAGFRVEGAGCEVEEHIGMMVGLATCVVERCVEQPRRQARERPRDRSRGRRSQLCEVTALRVPSTNRAATGFSGTECPNFVDLIRRKPAMSLRVAYRWSVGLNASVLFRDPSKSAV